MTKSYISILFLTLISIASYGQKGIFKRGIITQKQYRDTLEIKTKKDAILIDVKVNEKVYTFFLDTGAPTVFGKNIIGDFDIIAEKEISDASNNTETVKYISVPHIEIGNITYKNTTAMQYDIGILEKFGADGILGANIMAKSVWDFDLNNNRIIVSNKIDKQLAKYSQKSKIEVLNTGSPVMNIEHFNSIEEEIYIDFGFNGLYSLANGTYQIMKEKNLIKKSISGKGEFAKTAFGTTDSIFSQVVLKSKIGAIELPEFIADVDYDEESSIGSEILKYYRITLDFKKKRVYLTPVNNKIPTQFKSFGINTAIENNKMYVSFVWFSSKAYKDGIKTHDEILSINGIDTRNPDKLSKESLITIDSLFQGEEKIILEINIKENFIELKKETLLN
jgi:hypothetical protein